MISVNVRTRLTTLSLLLLAGCSTILLAGCSTMGSGKNITETELDIVPTESVASFSRSSQTEIASLSLSPDQLGAPTTLEALPSLATLTPTGRRSVILSEAWHLRGQNDVEVPIATSLERYLRAAHFAYEGIFAGDACGDTQSQLCKDLYAAYNRSAREVARLTNNGRDLLAAGSIRYIVDLEGDGGLLPLQDWDLTLDDYIPSQSHPALGASGAACQAVSKADSSEPITARTCAPVSFLVLFDERTEESRSRAHLVAYDTFEYDELSLHGRDVALQTAPLAAWSQIFTPPSAPPPGLSCLSAISPTLPTVVLVTTPNTSASEWPVIGSALSGDHNLADHYNFCATSAATTTATSQPSGALTEPLQLLAPRAALPMQVVVVSEGSESEQFLRNLKQTLKDERQGGVQPSLALAGSLALTAPQQSSNTTPPPPATTTSELSRHGTVALRDITRLLSKLADAEDGVFGSLSRSQIPHGPGEKLSPVM